MKNLPIVLLGLLALILIGLQLLIAPVIGRGGIARVAATKSELVTLKTLLDSFQRDCGRYPTTAEGLQALATAPRGLSKKWHGPYLSRPIENDAFGNPFRYVAPAANRFTLLSYSEDGVPGGEDLIVTN